MALVCDCHSSRRDDSGDSGLSSQTAPSTDIGIEECDEDVSSYRRCIENKVPAEHKKALEAGLTRTRATWKALAGNAGARPGLPQACRLARETAQTTLQQYGCAW
jgi:hypothetical protein